MNYHELFVYDPMTGNLIWRERPREHFAHSQAHGRWNTIYAGKVAGRRHFIRKGEKSAVVIGIGGRLLKAHQIIWAMNAGPIPDGRVVDHADVDPFNNAWSNLRLANRSQNGFNTKRTPVQSTGVRGVYPVRGCTNRYVAMIRKDGKLIRLGSFGSIPEAAKARKDGEILHFGEFAHP